jgi:amino acid adenylation domain-containing protein
MMADARPAVLLTTSSLADLLPRGDVPVMCLDLAGPEVDALAHDALEHDLPVDRLAYVMYTSGTSGEPKGVMITHANLCHYVDALQASLNLSEDDRYLHTASFAFSSSVRQAFLPLCRGAGLFVATQEQVRTPWALFELIRRLEITVIDIVPTYWRTCIQILTRLDVVTRRVLLDNNLRLILSASEPLMSDIPKLWARTLGHGASMVNMYGQTETAGIVTAHPVQVNDDDATAGVAVGRPIPNTAIYILNSRLEPAPIGVRGEIYVGGGGVGRGYLNRPELNAQKFTRDPFSDCPGARLYRTGDLGRYLPNGTIELLGRIDSQIKIRGFRIEPSEVEAELFRQDAVLDAVVVCQQDAVCGPRLVAFVVKNPERRASSTDLLRHLRAKLPDHAVPASLVFLDKIPLTENGKVDRRALQSYIGKEGSARKARAVTPPVNPTQDRLAKIWAEVLGTDSIGIHDNFFDIGGQSLLAAQMLSRIRDAYQLELPWRRLFEAPTIAGLSATIDAIRWARANTDGSDTRVGETRWEL